MIATLTGAFVASLVGSLHCVGMCGGLVAAYAGNGRRKGSLREHAAYHGMRLLAYGTLGTIAGAVGASVDLAAVAAGLGPIAVALAGGTMILMGLAALARLAGARVPKVGTPLALGVWLSRLTRFGASQGPATRAGVLGLSSALLPCGWLWAFVLAAAGTGSPLMGGAVLTAFWAGTVPALTGLGVGLRALAGHLGHRVAAVGAIAVIAIGVWTIGSRASMAARMTDTLHAAQNPPAELAPQNTETTQPQAGELPAEPSCCHGE